MPTVGRLIIVGIVDGRSIVELVDRVVVDILLPLVRRPIEMEGPVELVKQQTILFVIAPGDFVKLVGSKATTSSLTSVQIMRPD